MWECSCQGVRRGEEKATVVRDKGCREKQQQPKSETGEVGRTQVNQSLAYEQSLDSFLSHTWHFETRNSLKQGLITWEVTCSITPLTGGME